MKDDILHRLIVWWDQGVVGTLALNRSGAMHFVYDAGWLDDAACPALSQALPKQAAPFDDALCKAVFGGLLPEEGQRTAIARALDISANNPFRLLAALGGDVAGALAFLPEGQSPPAPLANAAPLRPLSDAELSATLDRLPYAPMLAGEGLARLSLAGAQSKLPVLLIDDSIALPDDATPSTHLIKPEPDRFAGLAANEGFCLALARVIGLDTAHAQWRSVAQKPFLLVTRYDRETGADGRTVRLHQEDFAQALGVPSNRKYATEGGPVFKDAFALVRRATTRPAREVLKLVDAALFNVIIGNADAHAKNFSLLRQRTGEIVLAPLYDLVATHMWPGLSKRFAMKFCGASTLEEIDSEAMARYADDASLTRAFIKRRAIAISQRVDDTLASKTLIANAAEQTDTAALAEIIRDRAQRLALKAKG